MCKQETERIKLTEERELAVLLGVQLNTQLCNVAIHSELENVSLYCLNLYIIFIGLIFLRQKRLAFGSFIGFPRSDFSYDDLGHLSRDSLALLGQWIQSKLQ